MPRINWGTVGERYFEAGTDRGVLYLKAVGSVFPPGIPWNGLISVSEAPTGGEPKPYYVDGFKYLNVASAEEFEATIEAFSAPDEFGQCDGTTSIMNGLFVTQQPRVVFGLSYRTKIGNDVDGVDHGYKIHLVYNALAAPSDRGNTTLSDSTSPMTLSWTISTTPVEVPGIKPTAHMVVDSRKTPPDLLTQLEDILYGGTFAPGRLIPQGELISLFKNWQ